MNNMKINKCLKKGQIGKGCNFIIIADCQLDITNSNLYYFERYRIVDFVPESNLSNTLNLLCICSANLQPAPRQIISVRGTKQKEGHDSLL